MLVNMLNLKDRSRENMVIFRWFAGDVPWIFTGFYSTHSLEDVKIPKSHDFNRRMMYKRFNGMSFYEFFADQKVTG